MAWPTNWATGEDITAARLLEWTNAQKTWPGDVDGGGYSLTHVVRVHTSGSGASLSLANRSLGAGSLVEVPTVGERWAFFVDGGASDGQLALWMGADKIRWHKEGWMQIKNASGVPGTPTGGGQLYAESGALKWKGSSGTVSILAVA